MLHLHLLSVPGGSLADVRPLEISLIDRSSTGHTFVNELKTPGKGVPVKLHDGDFFTCGIDPLRYTVCRVLEETENWHR